YTAQGIGRWYLRKSIGRFSAQAGYIYDQIGSGIIFRSYEERTLAIDNSLYGLQVGWNFNEDWSIRAFSGLQKRQFDTYNSVVTGVNLEGFVLGKEDSNWSMAPGIGFTSRTLDDQSMNALVATLNTYLKEDAFTPVYNTYAASIYNTLTVGPFNWYLEAAYKTDDNLVNPMGVRNAFNADGDTIVIEGPKAFKAPGSVVYTSLSYAQNGLGITLEGKRTENFSFRINPQTALFQGLVNFLPPMTRINTYRLNARYNAATQDLGEWAYQADIRYAPNRLMAFNVNFSNLTDLDNNLLYRELYTEFSLKKKRKWTLITGIQFQTYNQEVYEVKPNAPLVKAITPFVDYLYRLDRKKSVRIEAQYMRTGEEKGLRHDYGDWLFGQVEFSMAPHWTLTLSDMYNIQPGKQSPIDGNSGERAQIHYPRFDIFYTHEASRFSLSYVKQVQGIVCTGGICRLEPAFSGVKMGVTSTF
ncbi:MAG: hypothetical protein KDC44_03955, partial [Phaeodactylibacter sp.]|nr:hypothetical protein [Phaeodactylibacter sp.]